MGHSFCRRLVQTAILLYSFYIPSPLPRCFSHNPFDIPGFSWISQSPKYNIYGIRHDSQPCFHFGPHFGRICEPFIRCWKNIVLVSEIARIGSSRRGTNNVRFSLGKFSWRKNYICFEWSGGFELHHKNTFLELILCETSGKAVQLSAQSVRTLP